MDDANLFRKRSFPASSRFRSPARILPLGIGLAFGGLIFMRVPPSTTSQEPDPAFRPVADAPGLPRVLLIGDSISIGYTLPVRELFRGVANVHRPPVNCSSTVEGLASIEEWLGAQRWDVIHFNFGLHDLKHVDAQGKVVAPEQGRPRVPLEAYAQNLQTLVARLRTRGARLIWCATTPVPEGAHGRIAGSEGDYNRVARKVMEEHGLAVDDLHAFAAARLAEIQLPHNVHFTPSGYAQLAECVAASIRTALSATGKRAAR